MTRSDSIATIGGALAKAQGSIKGAAKDSENPHFRSRYADLASIWDACRQPLAANGIAVIQSPSTEGHLVRMVTLLVHTSGEWIESDPLTVESKDASPQGVGSCQTYLRRYQLASMIGVAPDDDDAEAAQGRSNGQSQRASIQSLPASGCPNGYVEWLADLWKIADKGTPRLEAAWKASKPEYRAHLTSTAPKQWDDLKKRAAVLTNEVPA